MAKIFTPKRVQKDVIQTLKIDKHDHAGNGLCLNTKPIVVVSNALQGETCKIKLSKQSKRANFGQVVKVLEASPERKNAFCQYYGQCGGCSLQHTSAQNGLALKEQALKDYVSKNLNGTSSVIEDSAWCPPVSSDIEYVLHSNNTSTNKTGYRRRIRLAVDARNKSSVKIGFRAANTQKIIDLNTCPIAVDSINRVLLDLCNTLKQLPSISKVGHVVVTQGVHELQVAVFVTHKLCGKSAEKLEQLALSCNLVLVIVDKANNPIIYNSQANDEKIGLSNEALVIEDKKGIKLSIKSTHFLQVNKAVNQQMISSVKQWLSPTQSNVLLDFFCGSGNFALSLAEDVSLVKGFEGIHEMVQRANENATINRIDNTEFAIMDLSSIEHLGPLFEEGNGLDEHTIAILDPSREGAAVLCQCLANSPIEKIVYVSCNANSFVRDAAFLLDSYRMEKIKALDMFPFTKHIELMALFIKK